MPGGSEEEVIYGSISNAQSTGKSMWGLAKNFDVLFTDKRLIFAVTAEPGKASLVGGGLGWMISQSGSQKKRDRYQTMQPHEILASHEKNFAIPYDSIEYVELRKIWPYGGITVHWRGGTVGCSFPQAQLDNVKQLVGTHLSHKMR